MLVARGAQRCVIPLALDVNVDDDMYCLVKRSGRIDAAVRGLAHVAGRFARSLRALMMVLLLSQGAVAHAGINTGLTGDDVVAGPFPIGFAFNYYGQNYTQFYVSTNGLLQFANPSSAYSNGCLPSIANTMYVFWDDLRTNVSGQPDGKIEYQTLGDAGARKLVVQWTNQYFYGTNLPMGTFQAVLFEGSNQVKLQYRYLSDPRSTGNSATIGIQGSLTTQVAQQGCNATAAVAPEQAISYTPDATGLAYTVNAAATYEFLDISGLTPAAPAPVARYTQGAPGWTWGQISELQTYQVEIQTDTGAILDTQTLGNVGNYTWPSGWNAGQSYLARVRGSVNSGGTWELWSGLSQPVTVDQTAPTAQMVRAVQSGPNAVRFSYQSADALSGLASVQLQVASDADFATLLFDGEVALGNGDYTFGTAVPGQRVYGRLRSTDRAGNSAPWSAPVDALVLPPPSAAFSASTVSGEAPLGVSFTNTTTGAVTSYSWDFGNGQSSSATSPSTRYGAPGSYVVTLRSVGVGGSSDASQTITVTPDVSPPTFTSFTNGGAAVLGSLALNTAASTTLRFRASDTNALQAVSATLSGQPLALVDLGGGNYSFTLDAMQIPDGTHVIAVSATDTAGNTAQLTLDLVVNLPPPAVPTLNTPANGLRTNLTQVSVSGNAVAATEVQLSVNGVSTQTWLPVTGQQFSGTVPLAEGANRVTAIARSNRGTSATSAETLVTVDTSKPAAPATLSAVSQTQGRVRLSFVPSRDAASQGTVVFRAAAPFDNPADAVRVTPSAISGSAYDDVPTADGVYYYRVASINDLGTLSALSNAVQARVDGALPVATSVVYTPLGKVDAATGRTGQGRVNLVLTVSEALQATPYLSIVPQGGSPIPIELSKTGDTTYAGSFLIDANTPSGVANALFSARDLVGNRGTDIEAGATLRIDTEGPALGGIVLSPSSPIRYDTTPTVQATFTFSKAPKAGAVPTVNYLLSGPVRSSVSVGSLSQVSPMVWQASFTLPSDAGLAAPEILSFSSRALDELDNVSTKVVAFNRFQVYQGNLPPLAVPLGLTAKAEPGGKVRLNWQAVAEATSYQIYRQSPAQAELVALVRTGGDTYIDQTPQDGTYKYAVATVRQSNAQESVSGQSASVEVMTAANAPGAPQSLALQLTGQGIVATWQPPLASTVATYNLYRGNGTAITSIEGLTPLKTGIRQPIVLDPSPSPTQGAYVVTALDAAGNESAVSNSAYLNASLLPVSNLRVEQIGSELPVITWNAPNSNVSGYLVYVGADASRTKLTTSPITAHTFSDGGYTSGERRYTIATVDANGVEMPRSVLLPNAGAEIASGLPILRGVMNKLQVQVSNTSAATLANVRVVVRLPINKDATQFKDHKSESLTLGANETRLVPVIVGGYAELPGTAQAQVGLEIAPVEGELVKIARHQSIAVGDSGIVVGMATEEFTRGATGRVRLTIENTSEVDLELLTATNNGNNDSTELRFKLLDSDSNVLATQSYKQALGANVVTLTNGLTVARIAAGQSYTSDSFLVNVPASSPNSIRLRLEVDKLRFHSGQDDEVAIAGRGAEKVISLVDTAYYGEVSNVTPTSSFGDQDVVITGRALDRRGNAPLPNTRLKLVLNQQGFERTFSVLTDGTGQFTHTFKPTITDSGLYKVSAVHPDVTDRSEQRSFTINRVTVGPTPYKLDVPKNYPFSIPFTAKAGPGTAASNLRLVLDAASQPTGQIPAGIKVQLPAPVSLAERQTLNVPVQFTASNDAQPSGSLILDVVSDESPLTPIGRVTVNYSLSEAKPFVTSTPSFVETGLARGGSGVETVLIENKGLQDAINLQFTLTKTDGTAAPAWINISNAVNGTLAVGAKRSIDLAFNPPAGTAEGVYEFRLRMEGENVGAQNLNVYASVTASGQGNVLFKAADIYTATVGKDGKLIPGLANARITLQNEEVATVTLEMNTDNLGEALFQNVPAGRYKFRATANNHQEIGGRLLVKPGITFNQSVFLEYNLITVEWSVREITIQDRYEITLNATFETDVPAAVVVMRPASINLPKMNAGDVYYGELTLQNHGLIRAYNLKQQLPRSDSFYRYEFLVEVPDAIEPKQRITVPYRVVSLQSLEEASSTANATGAGCYSYSNTTSVTCEFDCANGSKSTCGSSASWFSASNSSCAAGPGGAGGGSGGGGGGGWGIGGYGGGGGTTPIKLPGKKCVYIPNGEMKCGE